MTLRIDSVAGDTTTTGRASVTARAASSTYASIGRPHTAWSTLGRRERIRVPRPAAMTTATERATGASLNGATTRRWVMGAGKASSGVTLGAPVGGCQTPSPASAAGRSHGDGLDLDARRAWQSGDREGGARG